MAHAQNETRFSDQVARLWYEGKHDELYEIASQRLKTDPNDLPALLVSYSCESEAFHIEKALATLDRIVSAANTIKSDEFSKLKKMLQYDTTTQEKILKNYTEKEKEEEGYKKFMLRKSLGEIVYIKALEKDGHPVKPLDRDEYLALLALPPNAPQDAETIKKLEEANADVKKIRSYMARGATNDFAWTNEFRALLQQSKSDNSMPSSNATHSVISPPMITEAKQPVRLPPDNILPGNQSKGKMVSVHDSSPAPWPWIVGGLVVFGIIGTIAFKLLRHSKG